MLALTQDVKTLALGIVFGCFGLPALCADRNPVDIVRQSIINYQKDWLASLDYTYTERDVTKDSSGRPKTTEVSQVTVIDGTPYSRVIAKNGKPLSAEEARREDQKYKKALGERDNETPEERAHRVQKYRNQWKFLSEIPAAFNIKLLGNETIAGRPNYVFDLTPREGYTPTTKYGRIFPSVHGKLWIDEEDLRWTRAECDVIDTISMGWILARVGEGAKITIQQVRVDGDHWMPKELDINGSAKILLVKNRNLDETVSYTDYKRVRSSTAPTNAKNQ